MKRLQLAGKIYFNQVRINASVSEPLAHNVYNLLRQIASGKFPMVGKGTNRKSMNYVENVLKEGTQKARMVAKENIKKFKEAIGLNYFE